MWMASPAALMRTIMRILHQGLCRAVGLYVSHSRCLFMVCTTIRQAKEEPMTDILGQGEGRDLDPCASVLICYERCWHYIYCHVSITKLYVAVLCSAASLGQTDAPRAWLGVFAPVCRRTVWQQTPPITGAVAVLHLRRVVADRCGTVIEVKLTKINFSRSTDRMKNVREHLLPKFMISIPRQTVNRRSMIRQNLPR